MVKSCSVSFLSNQLVMMCLLVPIIVATTLTFLRILEIAEDFHLEQKVGFPTRIDPVTGVENILDLLFTTKPQAVNDVRPASGVSDHEIVIADISIKASCPSKPPRSILKWKSVDETDFKLAAEDLKEDFFQNNPDQNSVETNWTYFRDGLYNIVKKLVPQKIVKGKMRPRWLTTALLRLTRKKELFMFVLKNLAKHLTWKNLKLFVGFLTVNSVELIGRTWNL